MRFLWLSMLVLSIPAVAADTPNFCHELSVDRAWVATLIERPHDEALIRLSVLRSRLCRLVDRETVDFDDAVSIWQQEYARVSHRTP